MTPAQAEPAPSSKPNRDLQGSLFWRLLLTLMIGFSLPVFACFGLILTAALAFNLLAAGAQDDSFGSSGSGDAVAIIRANGLILSGTSSPFDTGIASADWIVNNVERAAADDSVKAIVLAVDSPGGGVVASDLIYHGLSQVDKPIVVSMGDVAASGGYYISMAADWVIANPNTLTGSIGVISEFPNAEELLDKIGVELVVIKSGANKDIGSFARDMTLEERQIWQGIIDETYNGFVQIVADGRNLPEDQVRELADGRIYTGRQALDLKLVDALGYEEDAIAKAAELGGIQGQPRIIEYRRRPAIEDFLTGFAGRSTLPSPAEIIRWIGLPSLSARWIGP